MTEALNTDVETQLAAIMQQDEARRRECFHVDYDLLRQRLAAIVARNTVNPTDEAPVTDAE